MRTKAAAIFFCAATYLFSMTLLQSCTNHTHDKDCNHNHETEQNEGSLTKKHEHDDGDAHDHSGHNHNSSEWAYSGDNGPEHWSHLYAEFAPCDGEAQSPVDISNTLKDNSLLPLDIHYNSVRGFTVGHSGRNILLRYSGVNSLVFSGKSYQLKFLSFHCKSEHTVAGNRFPMEVQLVHSNKDREVAILSVFVEEGAENNFFVPFIDKLPGEGGDEQKIGLELDVNDLLPQNLSYYTYTGSLSNPPCTENTTRILLKNTVKASKEQISKMIAVMTDNSFRPIQALNGREIKEFSQN